MGRPKIFIPSDELRRLYHQEHWSPTRIAAKYGCTSITVRSRLIESGIKLKTKSAAHNRYAKYDFNGTAIEKAYMLGFRYGDLNVYQPRGASETIVVRSHSTLEVQGKLFKYLFHRYGRITVSSNARTTQMTCYLNTSFAFLLDKYPPEIQTWLSKADDNLWAFAAGYIDAEGTFGLNQGRGRFKMDAYDHSILADLHALFLRYGINSKFRVIARRGENDYGWVWKQDVWRLEVNEAHSLSVLLKHFLPNAHHQKRIRDARTVARNIEQRRKNGTTK